MSVERIRTGNQQMDLILGGGFPARSIHIVMGSPGTGKTIFAERIAFAAAESHCPVLYATTLSEPTAKVIAFLQEYTFAAPALIGTKVIYETIGDDVAVAPPRIAERMLALIQQYRPRIIIIDSLKAISDIMPDMRTWRQVLYDLAGLLTAYDTTSFWIGEYTSEMLTRLPEFAVADGILELTRQQFGTSDIRSVRVLKLRGSDFRDGYHTFRITAAGLDVSPRLVTPAIPPSYVLTAERLHSGITGLDEMIETGWLRGSSTVVVGPSGAGKTVLGLHFLREGVHRGEPCLLVNFQENPTQLARIIGNFGWNYEQLVSPGKLDIMYTSPVELPIDVIFGEMFRRIEEHGVRRVVIDALDDLARSARDPVRFRDYVYTLSQYLALWNVTSLFAIESRNIGQPGALRGQDILNMSDNTLLLEMKAGADLDRSIRVLKSRGSAHDGRAHELRIGKDGIVIGDESRA